MNITLLPILSKFTILPIPKNPQNLHLPSIDVYLPLKPACKLKQNLLLPNDISSNKKQNFVTTIMLTLTLNALHDTGNVINRLLLRGEHELRITIGGVEKHRIGTDEGGEGGFGNHGITKAKIAGVDVPEGGGIGGGTGDGEEELDGAGAVVGVEEGDMGAVDAERLPEGEGDDECGGDVKNAAEEGGGGVGAEDDAAGPGWGEAGVVVGMEVGEEVGVGVGAGVAEGVDEEAGVGGASDWRVLRAVR